MVRMFNRPLLKSGLAAGALCSLALVAPVGAQNPPPTRTTADFSFRSNGDVVFSGQLLNPKSKKTKCKSSTGFARLYRTKLSGGATNKVATSRINSKTRKWELKDNRPGRYLVIVSATGCSRFYYPKNGTFKFDPPNPAVPRD